MAKPFRADTIQLGILVQFIRGSTAPTAGGGPTGGPFAINSLYWQETTFTLWQKVGTANTDWVSLTPQDLFGNGEDGDIIIGAGTTTNTRDFYYDDLTIQAAGILVTRGNRALVRGTLTIDVGGSIAADGTAGTAAGVAGAGAPSATGTMAVQAGAGGAGGVAGGAAGANTTNTIQGFTGAGGAGGAGSGGAGGAGGGVTPLTANLQGNPKSLVQATLGGQVGGNALNRVQCGAGGGGGGGDGTAGGGGGGGGGYLVIIARDIVNNGTIRSLGGGGGTPAAGDRGGGGGGGGGVIVLGFHHFEGNAPSVDGGIPGNGSGTGIAGSPGVVGNYFPIQL